MVSATTTLAVQSECSRVFAEMLELSEKGDNSTVDMLVGDICEFTPAERRSIVLTSDVQTEPITARSASSPPLLQAPSARSLGKAKSSATGSLKTSVAACCTLCRTTLVK